MVELANIGGGSDNITIVVTRFHADAPDEVIAAEARGSRATVDTPADQARAIEKVLQTQPKI